MSFFFQSLFKPHPRRRAEPRSRLGRFLLCLGAGTAAALALSVALVLCLRWLPPPISAMMAERQVAAFFSREPRPRTRYQWVGWPEISPQLPLAVIAAEDQKFFSHAGFDFDSINQALEKGRKGGRLRGASTITQQVAKNLFLWPGRSYVRKGLEAYFTVLLEALWPKKRILEVYVNVAEFGDGIYGAQAAAELIFHKRAAELTRWDAALLAAVLPNPKVLRAAAPSAYVLARRHWIAVQMGRLSGVSANRNSER